MGIDDGEANFPIPSHQIPQRVVLLWPGPGAMRVLQGAFACVHGPWDARIPYRNAERSRPASAFNVCLTLDFTHRRPSSSPQNNKTTMDPQI